MGSWQEQPRLFVFGEGKGGISTWQTGTGVPLDSILDLQGFFYCRHYCGAPGGPGNAIFGRDDADPLLKFKTSMSFFWVHPKPPLSIASGLGKMTEPNPIL